MGERLFAGVLIIGFSYLVILALFLTVWLAARAIEGIILWARELLRRRGSRLR